MQVKKVISLLLVGALCLGLSTNVQAASISEKKKAAQEKSEELQKKKDASEQEQQSLSNQLDSILTDMSEMEKKIDAKEEEISEKEDELIQAQVDENDQYESMKKRIKYMYENGDTQFVEILCEAKDLSDFLNKTEYITQISDYDRNMLAEFQKVVQDVKDQQEALQKEQDEMETMQNDLIAKQDSLQTLLSEKNEEIDSLKEEINANDQKLADLEAAEKAAEEAARKKAEAEAAAKETAAASSSSSASSAGASVVSGNGMFTHPCPGYSRISSTFGYRSAPLAGASTNHKGVDFAAPTGTPIYAAADGTVTSAAYSGKAGKLIVINHGNGLQTYYMHCNAMYVSAGSKVKKGQNIGAVGTTGNSTGPHLHFQVMKNGSPVNPLSYL